MITKRSLAFITLIFALVIFTSAAYADPPVDPTPPSGYAYASQTVNVTSFTQSWSDELLDNPGFDSWSGDNPVGWTVYESGSNIITETGADGNAGTGSARFVSSASQSPSMEQDVLVPNTWQELVVDVSTYTIGTLLLRDGAGYFPSLTRAGEAHFLIKPQNSLLIVRSGFNPPADYVVDVVSLRTITPNSTSTASADATTTLLFDLPSTSYAYQQIELRYRIVDASNYFVARLQRNATNTAWNIYLVRVLSGAENSLMSSTSVGTPDAIRVMAVGSSHTVWTGESGTYTQRGGTITDSNLSAATGITSLYSDGFTANSLTSWSIVDEASLTPTPTATSIATGTPTPTLTPTPTPDIWVYWTLPTEVSPIEQGVMVEYRFTGGGMLIAVVMFGQFVLLFVIAVQQQKNRRRNATNKNDL